MRIYVMISKVRSTEKSIINNMEETATWQRGGFPGGAMPGNMNNLMKQAQRMQRQMEEGQKELETKEFSASAGGGAVEVTINGKKRDPHPSSWQRRSWIRDIETLQGCYRGSSQRSTAQGG